MAENTVESVKSNNEHCMVCCEEIKFFSIGSCDHPICHKCSTRMRVLANQKYCPSCRCELDQVVFTRECLKFAEFKLNKLLGNRKYGIRFEDGSIRKDFESLQDYVCTMCEEGPFGSMSLLKSHIRKEHDRQFCLICLQNLTSFPFELKAYSKKELVRHRKEGDSDERSHRGHPECRFCDERFFDNDALLLHLRKSHFWCHFCEHDGKQDYYDVYESLRQHFASDHFLCDEGACINEKFTSVFRDEIDYKAHKLAMHRKKLNKFQAKEARKVDIDYKFESRSNPSNNITGADYEDVRQDTRRRYGNNNNHSNNKKSTTNHRYHREANGTLNFYDFEDVEKDRKTFLGKAHRHEAEEVDQEKAKVNRRMAATRSLSQSEPDIPTQFQAGINDDDNVIGFSERISDDLKPKSQKAKVKQEKKSPPSAPSPEAPKPDPTPAPALPAPDASVDNFPTLPGAKPFIPVQVAKKTEDFPALPAAAPPIKPAQNNWTNSTTKKKEITHMNGIIVKTAKSKKKGKQKQPINESDFPALGKKETKPPPSKFESPPPAQVKDKQTVAATNHHNGKDLNTKQAPQEPTALKRPPPGFKSSSAKQAPSGSSGPPGLNKQNPQNTRGAPPPGLKSQKTENTIAERNMRLVQMLTNFLDDFNMGIFRDLSGQYRRGSISGEKYYTGISEILADNLKYVFSELVALLPDENKQNELLRLHNDEKVKAKQRKEESKMRATANLAADYSKPAQWGSNGSKKEVVQEVPESRCSKCGVMVRNDEIQEHLENHGEAFPALPITTKKKKNYSFGSSSRVSKQTPLKSAWGK